MNRIVMPPPRVSREARLLIAALTLCLAAWVWYNFFSQQGGQQVRSQATVPNVPIVVTGEEDAAVVGDQTVVTVPSQSTADAVVTGGNSAAFVPPELSRVEIYQFPFLSTSAAYVPSGDDDEIIVTESGEVIRPQNNRVSINPFSPLNPAQELVTRNIPPPPPQVVSQPSTNFGAAPTTRTVTTTVPAPAVSDTVRAPVPAAITPPPSFATSLPRSLSRGRLSASPRVLTRPTSSGTLVEKDGELIPPDNFKDLIALRTPGTGRGRVDTTPTEAASEVATEGAAIQPDKGLPSLASNPDRLPAILSRPTQEPPPAPEPVVVAEPEPVVVAEPAPAPVVVRNPLDAYIEDNGLTFTGAVLGPVSIAVFRTGNQAFHIPTGRTLPDTSIVLNSVSAEQAQISLAGDVRTLSLEPSLSTRARGARD